LAINFDLGILNGRVFAGGELRSVDLWVSGGKVAALGGAHSAEEELDARGRLVLPGAVDAHVHFREPGQERKEDWASGSLSAASGGVTTVIDQPNTIPRTLDRRSFEVKLDSARHKSAVDFCINGGPGQIDELLKLGAAAIGEIFTYEHSDSELNEILKKIEERGGMPTIHAEDGAVIKECTALLKGRRDPQAYSESRPAQAEVVALEKVLSKSNRVHICHLSTWQGLELIRGAKKNGKRTTCEVAPHHLLLNKRDYAAQGSFLKMNPPLRGVEDNQALWQGLRDGSIDILASDHAPHLPEEKRAEIWDAPAGVPGVETMLPLMLTAVKSNLVPLERAVGALSTRPARIFGLRSKGEIAVGKDADFSVIDPRKSTRIKADKLHSSADWTPYEGREGIFPELVLIRGTLVYDGDLAVRPGYGRFLPGEIYKNSYQSEAL
jgi:dihydroorotase